MQAGEYAAISDYLLRGTLPTKFQSTKSNFIKKASGFTISGDALFRDGKAVVRYADRKRIFEAFHQHRGRDKCCMLVKERYYWPGGYTYISEKTKSCVACSYKKSKQ